MATIADDDSMDAVKVRELYGVGDSEADNLQD